MTPREPDRFEAKIREVYEMGYRDCERNRDRNPDRALIPPAAVPAADQDEVAMFGAFGHGEPATEAGKVQRYVCMHCGCEVPGNAPCPHCRDGVLREEKWTCRAAPPEGEGKT